MDDYQTIRITTLLEKLVGATERIADVLENKQSVEKNEIIDNCLALCKSWTRSKCDSPYMLPPDIIDNIQYQLEIFKSLDTKTE